MGKRAFSTKFFVEIKGLDETMNWLKHLHPQLEKAMRQGLKEATKPVLQRARANARYIQDDGTYAESLSLGVRKNGTQYVMKSVDVAAPVKEFAKPGAMRLVGPRANLPSQRDRLRSGKPLSPGVRAVRVGVPHRAHAPRVMVPAVEDSAEEVKDRIAECMERVLKQIEK